MGLQDGRPLFESPDGQTRADPRGAAEHWRMQIEPGTAQPFWANDALHFTTYIDPRGLPDGYELRSSADSRAYFVMRGTSSRRATALSCAWRSSDSPPARRVLEDRSVPQNTLR